MVIELIEMRTETENCFNSCRVKKTKIYKKKKNQLSTEIWKAGGKTSLEERILCPSRWHSDYKNNIPEKLQSPQESHPRRRLKPNSSQKKKLSARRKQTKLFGHTLAGATELFTPWLHYWTSCQGLKDRLGGLPAIFAPLSMYKLHRFPFSAFLYFFSLCWSIENRGPNLAYL